ncbi:acyltransferase family protein [Microbacterium sp. SLBN-146]|uniref:acyltransferase family protein n=1 Tax=Microbacterium sp. SLBN-146 TaxID=2768457 RepID=UPI001151735D|nr:acyltransferase family protein [Microbacterium sp. SLBN-146]TQJ30867.1 peptidoglycan/LPS O-acetylase OafA/YrhL [Microbacterium sp. SLBN-146]
MARPTVERGDHRRLDIQGLRTIAVLAVLFEHVLGYPAGGFVGVDVFFVISGFLITGILLRQLDRTGRVSFSDFYRKRIRRIMPAALLVLVVTVIAARLIFNVARSTTTFWDAVWSAFFAVNWRFASVSTDYFAAEGPVSPLQHYWSLSVEEQFYLVWPVVLALVGLAAARRRHAVAFAAIAVISAGSLAWAFWESATAPSVAYFSTLTRAWELGLGAMIALTVPLWSRIPAWLRPVLAWIGLAGIGLSLWVTTEAGFPAPGAILPVVSTALVLAAGVGGQSRWLWPLTNPVSVYIGNISYSLYLWHFPVFTFGAILLARPAESLGMPWLIPVATIAGGFVLAILSYHFVEQPVLRSRWLLGPGRGRRARVAPRHLVLLGISVTTLALVAAAVTVDRVSPAASSAPQSLPTAAPGEGEEGAESAALTELQKQIEAALSATEWPADLHPTLDTVSQEELPGNTAACGGAVLPEDPAFCTFGDPDAPKTAVLVGDSIAQMYVPALAEVFGTGEWKLRVTSMYACPFIAMDVGSLEGRIDLCRTRKDREVQIVQETQPDLVIIGNTYWRASDESGTKAAMTDWDAAFRASLDQIKGSAKALLALPPPVPDKVITDCMTSVSTPADCISSMNSTDWAEMANLQKSAIEDVGGVFIDNRAWFCNADGLCPPIVGSILVKKDQAHITADYARFITPVIRDDITATGLLEGAAPAEG